MYAFTNYIRGKSSQKEQKIYGAIKYLQMNYIVELVEGKLSSVIIPPKKNRKVQRFYDKEYYKERYKVECMFGFCKHYIRIFSRSFLHFVGVLQWLK